MPTEVYKFFLSGVVVGSAIVSTSCAKVTQPQRLVEAPPPQQIKIVKSIVNLPKVQTAKLTDVEQAVKRVFKDAVQIDTSVSPSFLTGDFNGDNSQDIAVALRPKDGKLDLLNEEYPSWLLRDPFTPNMRSSQALRVEDHDVLLAVIHGYGQDDWRDSEATQTFLLKNAVSNGMSMRDLKSVGESSASRRMPRFQGDVISQIHRGTPGYLYFNKATYAWYDPQHYRGESEKGVVHAGMMSN